jgi:hypothetical protein
MWERRVDMEPMPPKATVAEILNQAPQSVNIEVGRHVDGSLPSNQAIDLLALLVAARPQVVLEIGTFMGSTTRAIAMALPDAIIHTVDLPPGDAGALASVDVPKDDYHLIAAREVGREFVGTPFQSRIRQHFCDTSTWDFSAAEGATAFFIDGSHTYEHCKLDSQRCYELCGGEGVFLWHDCDEDHPGVVRALNEWRRLGRDVVRLASSPIAYWDGRRG